MKRVSTSLILLVVVGLIGVVWMIADVVREGASNVPGSTWFCGVLGAVLAISAIYREFGGQPIITVNPDHESEKDQFEDQKRRDGLV
ncbi:MAG: hypothetical protein QM774_01970 [Gordonia sp. (in: high G+C Gram-positive bacteria)]|uniref:hypothetical protein n=1 Tax=Gordonia sp. (in: high G+C Gram-positive bacteria) TaxID=84139 RepID=UPI0039E713AB